MAPRRRLPTRRLLATLVAAALAVAGLAGCRSEPGVAAYAGGVRLTEDRVTQVLDDARRALDAAVRAQAEEQAREAGQPTPTAVPQVDLPIGRQDVVVTLVSLEMVKAAARKLGVTPVEVPISNSVNEVRLPENAQFVQIYHEYSTYQAALQVKATPKEPTEADLRDIFRRLIAAGGAAPDASFTAFRQQSMQGQNLQLVQSAVALRDLLAPLVAEVNVSVNPRYRPELRLLYFIDEQGRRHPLVVLPLDGKPRPPAVLDAA